MTEITSLAGRVLIAMPGLPDDRFAQSVIFVCAHSDEGAMGLMVNRLAEGVQLSDLVEQLDIDPPLTMHDRPIHVGGPVEPERGFVLHSRDYSSALSSMLVSDRLAMTATLDIIEDMSAGRGPAQAIVALGYCGWGPGQLEGEIAENGWIIGEGDPDVLFSVEQERKWSRALGAMGVDPRVLSGFGGRA